MRLSALLLFVALAGCGEKLSPGYTLYHSGSAGGRMYFATFNGHEVEPKPGNKSYNAENCEMIADAMNQRVAAVLAEIPRLPHPERFWCEKGPFNP